MGDIGSRGAFHPKQHLANSLNTCKIPHLRGTFPNWLSVYLKRYSTLKPNITPNPNHPENAPNPSHKYKDLPETFHTSTTADNPLFFPPRHVCECATTRQNDEPGPDPKSLVRANQQQTGAITGDSSIHVQRRPGLHVVRNNGWLKPV